MAKVNDLLSSLKRNNVQLASTLDRQVLDLGVNTQKVLEPESTAKQERTLRRVGYDNAKEQMDKWLPIVKLNREKEHLNFTERSNSNVRVNFFPSNQNNPLSDRIEKELAELNMASQKQLITTEEKQLERLDPEQAKNRLRQVRKQRSLVFYEEIKRKRVSKIKSKLYHRIKKRQRMKAELEKFNTLPEEEKQQELEKLRNKRAQQRITLRHKTKSRHIQDLMRFGKGNKQRVQDSINELNRIRREQLEKLDEEVVKDISEEYDEQNFRQQAIDDLEEEVQVIERLEQNKSATTGLKFMDKALTSKLQQDKKEAYRLMEKLNNDDEMQVEEEDPADTPQQPQETTRRKYIKESNNKRDKPTAKPIAEPLNKILNDYIHKQTGKTTTAEQLVQGIDTEQLRKKYEPKRSQPIDMQQFIDQNEDLFENLAAAQNRQEFQRSKMAEIEAGDAAPKPKELKGWGTWTGPGISIPPKDAKKQLQDKLQRIEQIRKQRQDSSNREVIIHEHRNKQYASQYLVQKLPHNYKSREQFEFANLQTVGPEWNTLRNFKQAIQPKLLTKVGQCIQPARLPKKLSK